MLRLKPGGVGRRGSAWAGYAGFRAICGAVRRYRHADGTRDGQRRHGRRGRQHIGVTILLRKQRRQWARRPALPVHGERAPTGAAWAPLRSGEVGEVREQRSEVNGAALTSALFPDL